MEPIPRSVWRIAYVVVFGGFMSTLDTSLVSLGIAPITRDLRTDLGTAQWVASGYLLALAVALPACGWCCRRFGAARVWTLAMIGFTLTSALCAAAPGIGSLVAARVLQGLAAGLLVPAGQTLLGRAAGPQRLGRVMSTLGIAVIVAPALGPTLGGLLLTGLDWRWLFLVNVPLGVIAVALAIRHLPRDEPAASTPFDLLGLLLLGAGLPAVVYGITEAGGRGTLATGHAIVPLVAGAAALASYAVRLRRPGPHVLDVRLLGDRSFAVAWVAVFCSGAMLFGSMLTLPLYFQAQGHGLVGTGLLLAGFGVGGIVAMPIAGRLTDRWGGDVVGLVGAAGCLVTMLPFVWLGDEHAAPALVQVLLFLRGIAVGASAMPIMTVAYAVVDHDQLPDATALVNIAQRIGGALGSAVVAVAVARAGFGTASGWLVAAAGCEVVAVTAMVAVLRAARRRAGEPAPASLLSD